MLRLINNVPLLGPLQWPRGKKSTISEGHDANQSKGNEEHNSMHTKTIPF